MEGLSVIGKSIIRIDAEAKVMGKASFYSDIKLPGMLYVKVLRSPHPHAKILDIDTSEAERYPGVRCVTINKDAPSQRWGAAQIKDRTVFARGIVRYIGEPVAAVAAETVDSALEALDLIKVKYEVLPAVFDPEEAMSKAPLVVIHQDFPAYAKSLAPAQLELDRPNTLAHFKIRKGYVEKGFHGSDLVLENRFSTAPIQHCTLETHGVVVRPEPGGGLTLWTGRQGLWDLRGTLAGLYDIKASKIRIIQQYLGGGFGGKIIKDIEIVASLLALKSGRPVKWTYTREEEFLDGGHREGMIIYIKDGVKKDGTLLAREMKMILNAGGYDNVSNVAHICRVGAVGTYRTPNLQCDSYGVYTNEPPGCALRGFGVTEVIWAIESHMDMLAEKLNISPVVIRSRNILKEGETNATGEMVHSIGAEECLHKASDFINIVETSGAKGPWRMGKGIALAGKHSRAPTSSEARVEVTEGENIVIFHGADELGQGCNTAMAQIAAEEFKVSLDDVIVIFSDTLLVPYFAGGSTSSRVTFQLGNAVRLACASAKRDLLGRAAKRLGVSADELETQEKCVYSKADPDKRLRIAELFSEFRNRDPATFGGSTIGGEILGTASYIQDKAPEDPETGQMDPALALQGKSINSFYAYVAKAVEVAVNIETGQVKLLRCAGAIDMGKAINPKICEQQSEGGLAMGIGGALYEEMIMDRGAVTNSNLTDYRIPSVNEMPFIENVKTILVESAPHKNGPFGAKGFAEGAMIGMEPAIGNAVYNAVGIRIKDLPITMEKVLKALKKKAMVTG